LESTSKTLATLDTNFQTIQHTISNNLPKEFDTKLSTIQQADFTTALSSFGNKIYQHLYSQHIETTASFQHNASTLTHLSDEIICLSQNMVTLEDSSLSKSDVEHLVVQKWQDKLDPHIQSLYNFKQDATTRLDTMDKTLQTTIDTHLSTHPLLHSSTSTICSSPPHSTSFHQPASKDFSIFKPQKELKDIKLLEDSVKDIDFFWDSILQAFTNLCQTNQAYPYYHDLNSTFTFELLIWGCSSHFSTLRICHFGIHPSENIFETSFFM
jgi:hypothetical protein